MALNAYSLGTGVEVPVWNIFGLGIEAVGYQGTVLPVLAVSYLLATLEKRLHKITPSWLDNLSTPLIAILVTSFLTFTLIGPLMRGAGDMLASAITWVYSTLGFVGGGLFGGFYAPIVITGMHHSFIAVETQLIADMAHTGGSFIFVTASMSNAAQGAAVLAVLLVTKNEKMKSLCSASGISALLGITEPALFGVNLKLRYPFIAACIGSACGSAWIAFNHVLAVALGAAGLPGFISVEPKNWLNFGIGLVISIAVSFAMTLVLGKKAETKEVLQEESAPANAVISFVFPSAHAIGLTLENGVQMLIHCGINTVELNKEGFQLFVKEGQQVKQGTLLLEMDLKMVKEKGYSDETMVVLSEGMENQEMTLLKSGDCSINDALMKITKR